MSQAIRYTTYGDADVLQLTEVPLPGPGSGQVRIVVKAVGVNALDWKIRKGFLSEGKPLPGPAGTGIELAGVIDAVGNKVTRWQVGQAVFGRSATGGAAATHDLADADEIFGKPEWLSFEQAAALPVAVETAYRTLHELGVREGQTLLVHAAAGGVGLIATQLARAWGATVIGTASETNHAFLREIGAIPVTYGEGLTDRVRSAAPQGIDAVLDGSGRGVLPDSIALTGDPEKILTIADPTAAEHGIRFSGRPGPTGPALEAVLSLIEQGKIQMPIDSLYPLQKAADAHRHSENGHLQGKIVLSIEP
ncbi:NADP-dependent oxidoreductase [Streptomyces sp. NPDC017988]|uniref:NADP-dependent oxidoreductase n=1 Tax=Streptomyces sp. NPDC017988 TaxID=3365025 RepID=UPI00378ACAD6